MKKGVRKTKKMVESLGILQLGWVDDKKTGKTKFVNVGGFSERIVNYISGLGKTKRGIAYFVGSGKDAGGGRLSEGMACSASEWIRGVIRSEVVREERLKNTGVGNFKPLSEEYEQWKLSVLPNKGMFNLSGAMADAFGARRRGSHYVLGISASAMVNPIAVGGDGKVRQAKKVYVLDYATIGELGGKNRPARPIQTAAALAWVNTVNEDWGTLFKKYLEKEFWKKDSDDQTVDIATLHGGGVSDSSRDPAVMAENSRKLTREAASRIDKAAKLLPNMKPKGTEYMAIKNYVYDVLGKHYSDKEIQAIFNSMVSGNVQSL